MWGKLLQYPTFQAKLRNDLSGTNSSPPPPPPPPPNQHTLFSVILYLKALEVSTQAKNTKWMFGSYSREHVSLWLQVTIIEWLLVFTIKEAFFIGDGTAQLHHQEQGPWLQSLYTTTLFLTNCIAIISTVLSEKVLLQRSKTSSKLGPSSSSTIALYLPHGPK